MPEVKLSSKNQIVIPREAREALQIKAGARLRVVNAPAERSVVSVSVATLLPSFNLHGRCAPQLWWEIDEMP